MGLVYFSLIFKNWQGSYNFSFKNVAAKTAHKAMLRFTEKALTVQYFQIRDLIPSKIRIRNTDVSLKICYTSFGQGLMENGFPPPPNGQLAVKCDKTDLSTTPYFFMSATA